MSIVRLLSYWKVQDGSNQCSSRALEFNIDSDTTLFIIEPSLIQISHLMDPDCKPFILSELLFSPEGKRLFTYKDIHSINDIPMSIIREITEAIATGFPAQADTNGIGFLMQELYMTPNEINKLTKSQLDHLFSYIKEKNKKTKQAMGRKGR